MPHLPATAIPIYTNPLACHEQVEAFRLEGEAEVSFPDARMRLVNRIDPSEGQKSNFVFWCPEVFPADIAVSWEFWPIREPGLAMLFFSAAGKSGEDVFDPALAKRSGEYHQYHSGDIHAFHMAYFRRRYPEERAFHTCNLRKSYGAHLVCQGADPIPDVADALSPYRMLLIKRQEEVLFYINDLHILRWEDDGKAFGPHLKQGRIGFRQMAPLIAEYANLTVYALNSNLTEKDS